MRTTYYQLQVLVNFMERHGDLVKYKPNLANRVKAQNLWLELTRLLNVNDPAGGVRPIRTADKWKKIWARIKRNSKKNAARLRSSSDAGIQAFRNTLKSRVAAIINGNGQPVFDVEVWADLKSNSKKKVARLESSSEGEVQAFQNTLESRVTAIIKSDGEPVLDDKRKGMLDYESMISKSNDNKKSLEVLATSESEDDDISDDEVMQSLAVDYSIQNYSATNSNHSSVEVTENTGCSTQNAVTKNDDANCSVSCSAVSKIAPSINKNNKKINEACSSTQTVGEENDGGDWIRTEDEQETNDANTFDSNNGLKNTGSSNSRQNNSERPSVADLVQKNTSKGIISVIQYKERNDDTKDYSDNERQKNNSASSNATDQVENNEHDYEASSSIIPIVLRRNYTATPSFTNGQKASALRNLLNNKMAQKKKRDKKDDDSNMLTIDENDYPLSTLVSKRIAKIKHTMISTESNITRSMYSNTTCGTDNENSANFNPTNSDNILKLNINTLNQNIKTALQNDSPASRNDVNVDQSASNNIRTDKISYQTTSTANINATGVNGVANRRRSALDQENPHPHVQNKKKKVYKFVVESELEQKKFENELQLRKLEIQRDEIRMKTKGFEMIERFISLAERFF